MCEVIKGLTYILIQVTCMHMYVSDVQQVLITYKTLLFITHTYHYYHVFNVKAAGRVRNVKFQLEKSFNFL